MIVPPQLSEHQRSRFDGLLNQYRERLLLYIFTLCRDVNDAEDICQRSCLVLWKKFNEYDEERNFLSWACGIARLEAMNYRRSAAYDRLTFSSEVMQLLARSLDSVERDDQESRLRALRQCVARLSTRDQNLIEEIYWKHRPCDQVASEIGCSLQTFYNRMHHLRRRLMECVRIRLSQANNAYRGDHFSGSDGQ